MRASQTFPPPQLLDKIPPESLQKIALYRDEALWVLADLGFQGETTLSTFCEYIKSLRKLGARVRRVRRGRIRHQRANYSYCHLMELALLLSLRVYNSVPDSVLAEIVRYRASLNRHYIRAYTERCTGIGAPVVVEAANCEPIYMRGAFLDLNINFSGGTDQARSSEVTFAI
jgi:hypothetical protein